MLTFSLEAEESILGGICLDNGAMLEVVDILQPAHFHGHENAVAFVAMRDLAKMGKAINPRAVADSVGDPALAERLSYLEKSTPSAANIRAYAELVIERFYYAVSGGRLH